MSIISGLPVWAKVALGFLLLPVTICCGVFLMWQQRRFAPWTRVAVTALGGLLVFGIVASAATPASTAPVAPASAPITASSPAATVTPVLAESAPATPAPAAGIVVPVVVPPAPTAVPIEAAPEKTAPITATVYKTRTGAKYHANGCRFLSKSKIAVTLSAATAAGLTPCSVCGPPQ